jgi:hypothetical protein
MYKHTYREKLFRISLHPVVKQIDDAIEKMSLNTLSLHIERCLIERKFYVESWASEEIPYTAIQTGPFRIYRDGTKVIHI